MKRKTILCVDDEKMILDSLKAQLKRHFGDQFNYEVATSAEEAFEVIEELKDEQVKIIIILSDWLMPGTKGDDFLIQVHSKFPDIVKIMITGQADHESIKKAFQFGGLHKCIHKPWNEDELIDSLKSVLHE